MPEISVIVPCYNYGHFLADALDGLLGQEFKAWECIIVDDGSNDNTSSVAKSYLTKDSRIVYIYQHNKGLSAARNTGIAAAKGKYIQLLDADDCIAPKKLSWQFQYLESNPEADLVYGDSLYFNENVKQLSKDRGDAPISSGPVRVSGCGAALLAALCNNNIMEPACPLLRVSLLHRVGNFDTGYRSFEDWQFWFRCALAGACFHYRQEPGTEAYIRYGHVSMMSNKRQMNAAGFQIRRFMQSHLPGRLAWYNRFRLVKLSLKKTWLLLRS